MFMLFIFIFFPFIFISWRLITLQYCSGFKKLEIELPYDPAIPLLGIHAEETRSQRDTCTPMFIAALFMSLLFNMLSRLITVFLPRSKHLLISWLQSPSAVILEPKKIKSVTVSIVSPSIYHEVMGPDAMVFILWMLSFKPAFSLSSFTFIKRLFSSSLLSAIKMLSSAYLRLLIFLLEILIPVVLHPAQHFSWCTLHIS